MTDQARPDGPTAAFGGVEVPIDHVHKTKLSRPPQTVHIQDLRPIVQVLRSGGQPWPWQQVGVFPTEQEHLPWEWFNYTVGLPIELVVSCTSIEGRACDNNLVAAVLNTVTAGWVTGRVTFGDSIIVPLGIADPDGEWERDADAIWWLANESAPSRNHGVNVSDAERCCPIVWSSPLGWPE